MITKVKRTIPLLALLSAAMLTPLVYAADGNINITGRVSESACNIATSSKDMTIEMGEVNRSMFSSIGDGSLEKIFDLEIECGASSLVGVRLEGKASDANPEVFALDEVSGAKGIGLKLITGINGDERVAKPNGRPTFHYQIPGPSNIINNGLVSMLNMFQLAIISVGAVAIPCCKYHWTIFEHKVRARDEGGVDKRY